MIAQRPQSLLRALAGPMGLSRNIVTMSRTTIETPSERSVMEGASSPHVHAAGRSPARIINDVIKWLGLLSPWLVLLCVGAAATIPFRSSLHAYFTGDDYGLVQLFY